MRNVRAATLGHFKKTKGGTTAMSLAMSVCSLPDVIKQTPSETWSPDRQQLEGALNNWRECVLRFLRDQITEVNEDLQAAEDGLAIAHHHPGEVADDVIAHLWDQLENRSILLCRLARVSDRIEEMDLPALVTLFSLSAKRETHPWEGDAWRLPSSMF
jgi:hypothetical protein